MEFDWWANLCRLRLQSSGAKSGPRMADAASLPATWIAGGTSDASLLIPAVDSNAFVPGAAGLDFQVLLCTVILRSRALTRLGRRRAVHSAPHPVCSQRTKYVALNVIWICDRLVVKGLRQGQDDFEQNRNHHQRDTDFKHVRSVIMSSHAEPSGQSASSPMPPGTPSRPKLDRRKPLSSTLYRIDLEWYCRVRTSCKCENCIVPPEIHDAGTFLTCG